MKTIERLRLSWMTTRTRLSYSDVTNKEVIYEHMCLEVRKVLITYLKPFVLIFHFIVYRMITNGFWVSKRRRKYPVYE